MGFMSLHDVVKATEAKLDNGDMTEEDLSSVRDVLSLSLRDAQALIDANTHFVCDKPERTLQAMLKDLTSLLEQSELVPAELLNEIESVPAEEFADNCKNRLVDALDNFDYDLALAIVRENYA